MRKNLLTVSLLLCMTNCVLHAQTIENAVLTGWTDASGAIDVPYGVTSIAAAVFKDNKNITSVILPNSITDIEGSAFYGCTGLTSVVLPRNLKNIKSWVFASCSNLERVEFQENVEFIGSACFHNCNLLTEIYISTLVPPATQRLQTFDPSVPNNSAFATITEHCKVYVPASSVDAYKAADDWDKFGDNILSDEESGLLDLEKDNIKVKSLKGAICIETSEIGTMVDIYSVSGTLINSFRMLESSKTIELPQSIYILKINNHSLKLIVK